MNIVLIEDDEHKRRQILLFMQEEFPSYSVSVSMSYTSGLQAVRRLEPDLVLLDMSLPNYDGDLGGTDGGKFRSYGGRDILYQIKRRKIGSKVLIVTQYDTFASEANAKTLDTLVDELKQEFSGNFLDAVFYNASHDEWKTGLRRWLRAVS